MKKKTSRNRSSHQRCSIKKAVLKTFAIFTGKYLCWSLILINFTKKGLQHRCFPVNITKFLSTPILKKLCLYQQKRFWKTSPQISPKKFFDLRGRPCLWYYYHSFLTLKSNRNIKNLYNCHNNCMLWFTGDLICMHFYSNCTITEQATNAGDDLGATIVV